MPLAPALQVVIFDAQLLKDLRQWSHVNAWGRNGRERAGRKVVEADARPTSSRTRARCGAWLDQSCGDVTSAFNGGESRRRVCPLGQTSPSAASARFEGTFEVDTLARMLERRIFRALKTLPMLMGCPTRAPPKPGAACKWRSTPAYCQHPEGGGHPDREAADGGAAPGRGATASSSSSSSRCAAPIRIKDATAERLEIQNAAAMLRRGLDHPGRGQHPNHGQQGRRQAARP